MIGNDKKKNVRFMEIVTSAIVRFTNANDGVEEEEEEENEINDLMRDALCCLRVRLTKSTDFGLINIAMGYNLATCKRFIALPDTSKIQCLPFSATSRTLATEVNILRGTQEPNLSGYSDIKSSLIRSLRGPNIITGLV
ncbi:hypothetical protein GQX74_007896 [Glossina fuscipes]|nr:hypothetical protein GQX74_007896 [Glossina fuscipes]